MSFIHSWLNRHLIHRSDRHEGTGEEKEALLIFKGLGQDAADFEDMMRYINRKHKMYVILVDHANSFQTLNQSAEECEQHLASYRLNERFENVHLMGISRGGLTIRAMLERGLEGKIPNLGRCVMLGTPNQGSYLNKHLLHNPLLGPLYYALRGPSTAQMCPGKSRLALAFPSKDVELGIIAAVENGIDPHEAFGFPFPKGIKFFKHANDGMIMVPETELDGMTDHMVIEHLNHEEIRNDRDALDMAVCFLKDGRFPKKRLMRDRKKLLGTQFTVRKA